MESPKTLLEAVRYFSDEQTCINTVAAMRWLDGNVVCAHCETKEGDRKHYWLAKQKRWKCYACRKQFSVKVGTIFEDSPLSLSKWLPALWLLVNCKNGISSYEIHRDLGVTQKTAWFMLQRLRLVLKHLGITPLFGVVEMDETFVGGKAKNMHKNKRESLYSKPNTIKGKSVVVGMLERKGRVRAMVAPDRTKTILHDIAHSHIEPGSTLITDENHGYKGVNFTHEIVNHAVEYARGSVHTNGIENFWSLLKRSLGGTYVAVTPTHLERYIDEQAFRFNNRATPENPLNDADRFMGALSQVSNRRLTYAELTGKA